MSKTPYKPKYHKGGVVSPLEFLEMYCRRSPDHVYVYWNNKIMHIHFLTAMSFHSVLKAINGGIIRWAVRDTEKEIII